MKEIKGTAAKCASRVVLAAMIAVLGTGCAAKVNRDVLMNVKKVGILSITVDKLGTQATDDEVMQNTANYAARVYADALSKRPEWKLVPLTYKEPAFRDFLKPAAAQKKPDGKEATGFMASIKRINDDLQAAMSVENLAKKQSVYYLGASDMPIIPYKMIGKTRSTISQNGNVQVKEDWSQVRKEMATKIGELATRLNLDGLIVVYLRTGIYSSVGIDVVGGERALETVRMDPTLVLVSRDGRTAIDMGEPVIDAMTTKNAGMPIYKVAGHRGGTLVIGGSKSPKPDEAKFPIDLKDPGGKVQRDFYALTDLALKNFSNKIDKELTVK
jgi:hypothetical protein